MNAIYNLAIRPLLVVGLVLLVLVATFQVAGRVTMAVIDDFAPEINQLLSGNKIEIDGLEGDWHVFNPVLRARQVTLPAGDLRGVALELDWVESLARQRLVARAIRVESGDLFLVHTDDGWRLRGMVAGERRFDVSGLVYDSDEIGGAINIHVVDDARELNDAISVSVAAVNRGGQHKWNASISSSGCTDGCVMDVVYQHNEPLPWIRDHVRALTFSGDMSLPRGLVPEAFLPIEEARQMRAILSLRNGVWSEASGSGGGGVKLAVASHRVPFDVDVEPPLARTPTGTNDTAVGRLADARSSAGDSSRTPVATQSVSQRRMLVEVDLLGSRRKEQVSGEMSGGRAVSNDDALSLPLVLFEVAQGGARVWSEHLDLTGISGFLQGVLGTNSAAGRWISGLAVRGQAHNIHGFADLASRQVGYAATFSEVHLNAFSGVPHIERAAGRLLGYRQGLQLSLNSQDLSARLANVFDATWNFAPIQAELQLWFAHQYFGLRGTHIRAAIGDTALAGSFALTRPPVADEQRLSLMITADKLAIRDGLAFIPQRLPETLDTWLHDAPLGGVASKVHFAYQGKVRAEPDDRSRRLELSAQLSDAAVRFDPAWPVVTGLHGHLHVAGANTSVAVTRATTLGVPVRNSAVLIADNGRTIEVELSASLIDNNGLDYVRNSPLREQMGFVGPDWQAKGRMNVSGVITVPLHAMARQAAAAIETVDTVAQSDVVLPPGVGSSERIVAASEKPSANLKFSVDNLSLSLPEYRLKLDTLRGAGTFATPHHLSGIGLTGQLFGEPVDINISNNEESVSFGFAGRASESDIYYVIGMEPLKLLSGVFDFAASLSVAAAPGGVTTLQVDSDLVGLQVTLPAEFGKRSESARPLSLTMQMLSGYQAVSWQYSGTTGWLHVDGAPVRGAVGIHAKPGMIAHNADYIAISGRVTNAALADWVSEEGGGLALPVDWRIVDLQIDTLEIGELAFDDVRLSGRSDMSRGPEEMAFDLEAPDLQGVVVVSKDQPLALHFARVRLPDPPPDVAFALDGAEVVSVGPVSNKGDPFSLELADNLPEADVSVGSVFLGDEDFGSWNFKLRRRADALYFEELHAKVKGVAIDADALVWEPRATPAGIADTGVVARGTGQSWFSGTVLAENLAQTLPQWGYAPTLETSSASVTADVRWSGSPVNFALPSLLGYMAFTAEEGRFLDVESGGTGALRIMSLLNFSKIAKRVSLDFSDVTGKGLSFEAIDAQVRLRRGTLTFERPMVVTGSGSEFRVGGSVNLVSGELANELIVTLPVSKGLPWYAAYVALANPLAGLGVLVGERVFRKPLEQFSSAKYEIGGTLDDPNVKFAGVFNRSIADAPIDDLPELALGDLSEEPHSDDPLGQVADQTPVSQEAVAEGPETTSDAQGTASQTKKSRREKRDDARAARKRDRQKSSDDEPHGE